MADARLRPPPIYGYVERLDVDGHDVCVAGWALSLSGPADDLTVREVATGRTWPVTREVRADLREAVGFVPDAERGGFSFRVPVASVPWPGTIDLELTCRRAGRLLGSMRIEVHHPRLPITYPPDAVMRRATGSAQRGFWLATGIKAGNDFLRALAAHADLSRASTLLEWGCGSGRLTRHLIDRLPHVRVTGTDIDREAVQWAAANLEGTFVPCATEPPLPFADASFDLVCALSVCTHLTRAHQELWLPEIRRVVRPGGTVALTTHGEWASRWIHHRPGEHEEVMATGFHDGRADHGLGHVAGGDYYRSTFQSRAWTLREWSRWFDVVDYLEAGINDFQDLVVLVRRRDEGADPRR